MSHNIDNYGKAEQSFVENVDEKNIVSSDTQSLASENEYLKNYDPRKIIMKMDWKILPVMSVLYLMSFLDRTNIGNAKVAGLATDLHLTDLEYRLALTCFFFTYAAVEVPSNLLLKKLGAKLWLPIIMMLWGICCIGLGFVRNYDELLIARIMLGLAEGGLFPGVTYYLTTWYPRSRIALRIAIFFSAATIAGAFGGLLAYALQQMDGVSGLRGWQWIFIIEGIMTCAVALGAYFFIPNSPAEAHWLTEEEQKVMRYKIAHDAVEVPFDDSFAWKYVRRGALDWKLHLNLLMYLGSLTSLYSVSLSLPSIVKGLGYTSIDSAQLHTVPVYIVACFCVVAAAYIADRSGRRSPVVLAMTLLGIVGWTMMYTLTSLHARYAGAFLAASGAYSAFPPIVAILTGNIGGKTKRAVVIGLQVGIGGMAGTISSNIFRAQDAPRYQFGIKIDLIASAICFVATFVNLLLLIRANKKKERCIASGEAATYSREHLAQMGDDSPYFMYKW